MLSKALPESRNVDSIPLQPNLSLESWQRIPWAYSTAMILATAAFFLVIWLRRNANADPRLPAFERWTLFGAAFVGGTLGGKLPFVLAQGHWWSLEPWFMNGKTITTGLIGAYVTVEVVKAIQGIHIKTGDRFALPLAAAFAVGRWGCFFNGCCYGAPCDLPWAVAFEGVEGLRHPTQIYEAIFHTVSFAVLWWIAIRGFWVSHQLQLYLIAYCGFRFLTEWIRPEPEVLWRLTFYQWTVLGFAILLVTQWICERPGPKVALVQTESIPGGSNDRPEAKP
jgi:phosphatidylglycerol:prolipoprotein diacylglycerol transferase